jgi:hypothetical protein
VRRSDIVRVALTVMVFFVVTPVFAIGCGERQRLDEILNVDPAVWEAPLFAPEHTVHPLHRMYDIIDIWAVAVAIGDYAGAQALGVDIFPELERLFEQVDVAADATRPETIYTRLVVSAMLARIALVDHDFLTALRYGRVAIDDTHLLAETRPGDPRAGFFLGLYHYYTGAAPLLLRGVGMLAGVRGDRAQGTQRLEDAVLSNQPLAPEAARVLLEEVRERDRPVCRYLPLAKDLAATYPDNYRFHWFVERERARCDADPNATIPTDAPRLLAGCRDRSGFFTPG